MCPAHIAQARIDERGLKDTETIPHQLARIHKHHTYDLVVNTDLEAPDRLACRLLQLQVEVPPKAFTDIMWKQNAQP